MARRHAAMSRRLAAQQRARRRRSAPGHRRPARDRRPSTAARIEQSRAQPWHSRRAPHRGDPAIVRCVSATPSSSRCAGPTRRASCIPARSVSCAKSLFIPRSSGRRCNRNRDPLYSGPGRRGTNPLRAPGEPFSSEIPHAHAGPNPSPAAVERPARLRSCGPAQQLR